MGFLGTLVSAALLTTAPAGTTHAGSFGFDNLDGITILDAGAANPYPSTINVSGATGAISDVDVTVHGIAHTRLIEVDIALLGPNGVVVGLLGGRGPLVSGLDLTFDDAAPNPVTDPPSSGTFRPTWEPLNPGGAFPGAPSPPYDAPLAAFNGVNPNGEWQLLVRDTESADVGSIAGWSLSITTVPYLSIGDASVVEGDAGTTAMSFTVSLDEPAPAGGVEFDIATAAFSAVSPQDYVSTSLTHQTIPPGMSTYTFLVPVNGDTTAEGDESFYVNVTNVTGAVVADGQAVGTILDDDTAGVTLTPTSGLITTEAGGTATFTAVLTSPPAADVQLTATSSAPSEATVAPSSVTFTPADWNVPRTFTVTGIDDAVEDGDTAFSIALTTASVDPIYDAMSLPAVSGINLDDDTPPATSTTTSTSTSTTVAPSTTSSPTTVAATTTTAAAAATTTTVAPPAAATTTIAAGVPATTTTVAPARGLPATGSSTGRGLLAGVVLVAGGAAVLAASRRRPEAR